MISARRGPMPGLASRWGRVILAMRAAQFAGDELAQPRQILWRRRIGRGQELFRKPHGAERRADGFANSLVLRECDFAAAAAQVDEQDFSVDAGFAAHHAAMDEAAL